MSDIRYFSTNGKAPQVSLREALLRGQAPDRGLYMPERIPPAAGGLPGAVRCSVVS